jgi:hypothetical protein
MNTRFSQLMRRQSGQSLVEFAFGLVVLLIMLVGLVDGSRALFTYIAMSDAAQEAALYGSTDPNNTSQIRERARDSSDLLKALCPTTADCDEATDPLFIDVQLAGAACMGQGITVTIDYYAFPLTMPFVGAFIGGQTVPIHVIVTDTILRPPC